MRTKFLNNRNHIQGFLRLMIALTFCIMFFHCSSAQTTFRVQVIGNGAPMILIPGMSCSGDVWKSTVIHYQDKYQCHVLTLAGFAGVPPVQDDAFLDHVKNDVIEYIKENNLKKPVLVGHSLGGFIAMWVASEEPNLVGKLVIVDALPYLPAAHYPNMTPQVAYPFATKLKERIIAQPDDQYKAAQKYNFRTLITDTATANAAGIWGVNSDKTTVAECTFEMQTIDLREEIQKITAPTLVFATWIGNQQEQTHDGVGEIFKAQYYLLKNYKLVIEDNARNFVMLDDPQVFFDEMDKFLSGN